MIPFKNFRAEINEAADISGLSIDQLKKKFRRSIADYRKDGFFKNDKIEKMFMQWGMSNGEIRTDDYAEFEDMMDRIVYEDVFKNLKSEINEAVKEDGHKDVKSAMNQVKIAASALNKMNTELGKLNAEDPLPTWWTNKVAIAVDKLDAMADYLDTQVEDKFEPHMMYDPKTGKGYKANTMDDHLRMKELGYTHKKIDEAAKVVAKVWYGHNNKTKSRSFSNEGKALAWVRKMQDLEDVSDYSIR